MRHFTLMLIAVLASQFSFAQFQDSVLIDEVKIVADKVKHMAGVKVQRFDTTKMQSLSHSSLAEAISRHTPIYVKQNAGGLSTIFFRGTTADHTAIMFGDINLNSLTLGHANLANIPMFLFDEVAVQYGSASSLYGTDAIGGVIKLKTTPRWQTGVRTYIQQDVASFGSFFTGVKLSAGGKRWENTVRFYRSQAKNDFLVENIYYTGFNAKEKKQENAAIFNWGILNEFYYKLSNKSQLSVKAWYDYNWHEVQFNISDVFSGATPNELENQNIRTSASYQYNDSKQRLEINLNFVRDRQLYNKNDDEIIATNRIVPKVEYERKDLWDGQLLIGSKYAFIKPDVYAYDENLNEHRLDIYTSYQKTLFNVLDVSVNLREMLVNRYTADFVPSVGLNYKLLRFADGIFSLKASASKGYKIPTFNDRAWRDATGQLLGTPDLSPEKSIGGEFGQEVHLQLKNTYLSFTTTQYFNQIENLISWVPAGSNYRPMNTDKVHTYGLEVSSKAEIDLNPNSKLTLSGNYSFNQPVVKEDNGEKLSTRQYLIYSPIHAANMYGSFQYRFVRISSDVQFTGERYTNATQTIDAYCLANLEASARFKLFAGSQQLSLSVFNLLNSTYQNWEAYAMPGRNYRLSLKLIF